MRPPEQQGLVLRQLVALRRRGLEQDAALVSRIPQQKGQQPGVHVQGVLHCSSRNNGKYDAAQRIKRHMGVGRRVSTAAEPKPGSEAGRWPDEAAVKALEEPACKLP